MLSMNKQARTYTLLFNLPEPVNRDFFVYHYFSAKVIDPRGGKKETDCSGAGRYQYSVVGHQHFVNARCHPSLTRSQDQAIIQLEQQTSSTRRPQLDHLYFALSGLRSARATRNRMKATEDDHSSLINVFLEQGSSVKR